MAIIAHGSSRSKSKLARELGVCRQSLYYIPKLPRKDWVLKASIEAVMTEHPAYGHKRLAMALGVNKKRVLRVMKQFHLVPQRRRGQKPEKASDRGQETMNIPNRIRGLAVSSPNQVWVSDFTYLPYQNRFVYLATVEDLFTRQIRGWSVSVRHNTHLVVEALLDALSQHQKPDIFHSDQGSEYRSELFLTTLRRECILSSMSEKGCPTQNGYQESFYSQFKLELGHPDCYETMGELIEAIALQIHYYNNKRIHSALKCAPNLFEKQYELNHGFILSTKTTQKGLSV